jgi:hypothetical protein
MRRTTALRAMAIASFAFVTSVALGACSSSITTMTICAANETRAVSSGATPYDLAPSVKLGDVPGQYHVKVESGQGGTITSAKQIDPKSNEAAAESAEMDKCNKEPKAFEKLLR